MTLTFSAEQEELRAAVRRLVATRSPLPRVREVAGTPSGLDRPLWTVMAGQLGLQGLGIPQEYGGSGYGPVETGVVFEELGHGLACSAYLSTVALAAAALLHGGDQAAMKDYLPGIADGSTVATLAFTDADGDIAPAVRAEQDRGGWALSGTSAYVTDAMAADLILVVAAGGSLFAVDAAAVSREPMSVLDRTRPLARLTFEATPARLVGRDVLAATLDVAGAALAAEAAGAARHCLDSAVAYAGSRVQFGRPIGSFQAIKHKCADMLVDVEATRSAAYYAAWALARDPADAPLACTVAAAWAPDALFRVAAETIQIHGGIGYTWEHDAHLYFRRARSSQALFGTADRHRDRLATLAGYGEGSA